MPSSHSYHFEAKAYAPKSSQSPCPITSMSSSTVRTESPSSFPLFTSSFSSSSSSSVPPFSSPSTRVYVTGRLSPSKISPSKSPPPSSPLPSSSPSSPSSSSSSSPSITELNDIWSAYQHQRSLVSSLQSQLSAERQAARQAAKEYEKYRQEMYDSISRLKEDFIDAQNNYEKVLEGYRREEREREEELTAVKKAIRAYREQLAEEVRMGEKWEEQKEEEGSVDFSAEVTVVHRSSKERRRSNGDRANDGKSPCEYREYEEV